MTRQWVERACPGDDGLVRLVAERLIALAAGAVFVVAPLTVAVTGLTAQASYAASFAIALTLVAIPFLALGWLSLSAQPWRPAVFAFASWCAMAGALVAVSPIIAGASAIVLFFVAATTPVWRTATEAGHDDADAAAGKPEATDAVREPAATRVEILPDGRVETVSGMREECFDLRRLFVDKVHVADRVEFQRAFSDVVQHRRPNAAMTLRLDLAERGATQNFQPVSIEMLRDGAVVLLLLTEPAAGTAAGDADDEKAVHKARFLATVSHELRTPLNSIIGFSDMLRQDTLGPMENPRQREYVELIHGAGTHLLSVVNTMLDVSKMDAGTYSVCREPFDLNDTVAECVSMLEPQAAEKHIAIEVEHAPAGTQADGDRRAVKQILINLLSNAVKFTAEGGSVTMRARQRRDGFELQVTDSGIGMSSEELDTLGQPFAQADNAYTRSCEGTGLGLVVVKGLVRLHDGRLDVESRPGRGTTVTVFIPAQGEVHSIVGAPAEAETDEGDARPIRADEIGEQKNVVRFAG